MYSRHSLLTCVASFVALAVAVPAHAQERLFDIPAQPAVRAIPELARQAQVQIVAPARDLAGINTPAIKGRMDVREALRRLIAGTPLRVGSDDGNVITLRSARPARPIGRLGPAWAARSKPWLTMWMSVSTMPGRTQFTRTPLFASSCAMPSVSVSTAPFEAA